LVSRAKPTEQYHLALGGRGLDRSDDRRHAMGVLDVILGGSMSSRLFQEIREKRGLAYSVGTYSVGYSDTGQVGVYLGTREENLAEAAEIIGRELRRMGDEPVPEAELSRAREHLKGRLVLGLESPATRMHRNGRAVLSGTELLEVDELVDRAGSGMVSHCVAYRRVCHRVGRPVSHCRPATTAHDRLSGVQRTHDSDHAVRPLRLFQLAHLGPLRFAR
jgi:predicted Zn-dependent peptidase